MEITHPTHFQLAIQITHYADILHSTGRHVTGSVIVLQVTCRKEIFSCFVAFVNGENCTMN